MVALPWQHVGHSLRVLHEAMRARQEHQACVFLPQTTAAENASLQSPRRPTLIRRQASRRAELLVHLRGEFLPVHRRPREKLSEVRRRGSPLLPTNDVRLQGEHGKQCVAIALQATVILPDVLKPSFAVRKFFGAQATRLRHSCHCAVRPGSHFNLCSNSSQRPSISKPCKGVVHVVHGIAARVVAVVS